MAATPHPRTPHSQRLILTGVSWEMYSRLLRAFAERPAIRLTYDRGVLEIRNPLREYGPESDTAFLGRLVVTMTEEMGLPIKANRSTTLRRRKKQRGLEADNSYWIANEPQMRGKRKLNLRTDPPPDLAIEVDVTRSSLNRMSIYARLGVPEVWRLDDDALSFQELDQSGQYQAIPRSKSFPLVTPADLTRFLALRAQFDENEVVRQFRAWFRQQLATGGATPPP